MNKNKHNFAKNIFFVILALAIAFAVIVFAVRKLKPEEETMITSETVESSLKEVKELTTLKYHYKNIASYENSQQFQGMKVPFTTKRFLYTYEGEIHAGIDLDEADIDVNNETKIINVTLPESKILSHDINEDSVMVYDEKNSIFNPLELEDYSNFRKEEEAKVEKEAIDKGLLTEASEQTRQAIKDILNINPQIEEEYTINIK